MHVYTAWLAIDIGNHTHIAAVSQRMMLGSMLADMIVLSMAPSTRQLRERTGRVANVKGQPCCIDERLC